MREWLPRVLEWMGVGRHRGGGDRCCPASTELVALAEIESLYWSGRYDVVVVDCAPTAETLRLLSLPDLLLVPPADPSRGSSTQPGRGPGAHPVHVVPGSRRRVFDAGERFTQRLERVHRLLADPEVTTVRLVVNPERMVVAEARRTYAFLSLFGYPGRRDRGQPDAPRRGRRPVLRPMARGPAGPSRGDRIRLRPAPGAPGWIWPTARSSGPKRSEAWARPCGTASTRRPAWWTTDRGGSSGRGGDIVLTIDLPRSTATRSAWRGPAPSSSSRRVRTAGRLRCPIRSRGVRVRPVLDAGVVRVTFSGPQRSARNAPVGNDSP